MVNFINPYQSEEILEIYKTILPHDITERERISLIGACDEDGTMLGVLAFDDGGAECRIRWIYVEPFARRQGVATALVEELIDFYMRNGDIKPISLSFRKDTEESEIMLFLSGIPYFDLEVDYKNELFRLSEIDLDEKILETSRRLYTIQKFFELSEAKQEAFLGEVFDEGYYEVTDLDNWKQHCDPDLCFCTMEAHRVDTLIIMEDTEVGLEIGFLYAKNPKKLLALLCRTIEAAKEKNADAVLSASVTSERAGMLLHKLFKTSTIHYQVMRGMWNYTLPDEKMLHE